MVFFPRKVVKRNTGAIIGVITGFLAVVSGIVGLVVYIVKISMSYQKLKSSDEQKTAEINKLRSDLETLKIDYSQTLTRFEQNEKRDEEERASNSKKFNELYNSRNQTTEVLVELSTQFKLFCTNQEKQFAQLDKKIDELKESIKDNKR